MNLFSQIKAAVTTRQAAEHYGLKVSRNGMTCCPFHNDQHPSMKVDDRYYCFACHETGDVIDFVGRLFNLAPYDAAVKIAADFGLHPTTPQAAVLPVPVRCDTEYDERQREGKCAAVLIDYECLLKDWRNIYAPDREDETWDRHFTAAVSTLPQVTYLIDCLYSPDAAERAVVTHDLMADGTLDNIVSFMEAKKARNEGRCSDERAA